MDWASAQSERVAAAAAEAATTGGTAQGAMIMKELAKLTTQLVHRQLQYEVATQALRGLQSCEEQSKKCVEMLVEAIKTPQPTSDLAADAIWTLNKITQQCRVTRQWTRDAGGTEAIRQALVAYPQNRNLVLCAVWSTYTLEGLQGLASLMGHRGPGVVEVCHFDDAVVLAVVWVIFELRSEDCRKGKEPQEAEILLGLTLELCKTRRHHAEVLRACCFATEALIREEPKLGALLVQLGGAPLLLQALRRATEPDSADDELAGVCADALISLVQGGAATAARAICQESGAPEVLATIAARGYGNAAEERAMIALGYLVGLGAVMQVMRQAPVKSVIRGGLEVIARLADKPSEEAEVRLLPDILGELLTLRGHMDGPAPVVKCRQKCARAICGTVRGLAFFAEPGQVKALDDTVMMLLQGLETEDVTEIMETYLECLGRIVLLKETWRMALHSVQAPQLTETIIERFNQQKGHRKLMKYSFWFAAALSGISFVARQLKLKVQSTEVVDAAFCTIIDILDDDIEGDWVLTQTLTQTERCSERDVPEILELIIQAMKGHVRDATLQSRGCHCIGLLLPLLPPSEVLAKAVASVLNAARSHARSAEVLRDACYALRTALQPGSQGERSLGCAGQPQEAIARHLREELKAEEVVERALTDFAMVDEPGLLEDAVVVLATLSGINTVLKALLDALPGPVRTSGAKALFEFGRQHPHRLRESAANVLTAVERMLEESGEDCSLQQNAALLVGLCNACAPKQPSEAGGLSPIR